MENQGTKNAVDRLNNLLRAWFYSSHKEQEKQPSNELKHIPWQGWKEVGKIGEGSFGAVYKIKHSLLGTEEYAALKVISVPRNKSNIKSMSADGMDDESITKRIEDEAKNVLNEYEKLLALQGTPNIVHCKMVHCEQHSDAKGYDIYILMELLTPFLDRVNELKGAEKQIIRFGSEMCNALVVCENKGILHRDIKPENVFVSKDGVYKLGDFGIARSMDHTTYATQGVGTPSYMAPEVANGKEYNKQADIYSLGMMLYWLLNEGRIPFLPLPPEPVTPTNRQTALDRRKNGEQIPAPKNGSEKLKKIVLKACAFEPEERYQTAREMQKDLSRLCGDDSDESDDGGTVGPDFGSQCKKCGHNNAAGSTHCSKSGASFVESDDGGTVRPDFGTQCKKCGHENTAGSTHCAKCGASLNKEVSVDFDSNKKRHIIATAGIVVALLLFWFLKPTSPPVTDPPVTAPPVTNPPVVQHQHVWEGATYNNPEYCSKCGETKGLPKTPTSKLRLADIVVDARATSVMPEKGNYSYYPKNLYDQDILTYWVEGEDGAGIGESATLYFDDTYAINELTILIGSHYQLDSSYYERHNRPSTISLYFSDGSSEYIRLEDTRNYQTIVFAEYHYTDYVKIVIEDVYSGTDWNETIIAEVDFAVYRP